MTGRGERSVATALAGAFLAGDWTAEGLWERGTTTLGRRPRWLVRLVPEVLSLYRDPPTDRARELAAVIAAATGPALAAARRDERPERVVRWIAEPAAMAPRRWPVAPVATVADLADLLDLPVGHLLWYADTSGMQRRARVPALHLYRYRWLTRLGRTPRLLEVPRPRLRRVQRIVLDRIAGLVPTHPAVHGFVRGRSCVSGAQRHVGAAVVIGMDLAGFFAAVGAPRVYGILRTAGYPEAVAHLLTGLGTTATPIAVLTAMPPGGEAVDRFALRQGLAAPHLPQGAPTSPQWANLTAYRLDCRIAGLAAASGVTYTRYADDLTLSGRLRRPQASRLVDAVRRIAREEGFRLNEAKTRIQPRATRQLVTGIVVNDRRNAPREDYDALRAILHNAARTGAAAQNQLGHPDFRAHLLGRIGWIEGLNPGRGRRLRADFDRVDWAR